VEGSDEHSNNRNPGTTAGQGGAGGETGVVEVSLSVFLRRVLVSFFLPFFLLTVSLALAACTSEPSLIRAAKEGDTETVKTLLAAGADVHAKDRDGWTALMQAAFKGHTDIVQTLLAAGTPVGEGFIPLRL